MVLHDCDSIRAASILALAAGSSPVLVSASAPGSSGRRPSETDTDRSPCPRCPAGGHPAPASPARVYQLWVIGHAHHQSRGPHPSGLPWGARGSSEKTRLIISKLAASFQIMDRTRPAGALPVPAGHWASP